MKHDATEQQVITDTAGVSRTLRSKRSPEIERVVHIGEEIANSITHGVGAALSIAGLVVLIVFAALRGSAWAITGCSIYGATLILLYLSSTLYHAFPWPRVKRVFRIFDHCAIYLLIAGTYTPFVLVAMRNRFGWFLLAFVWMLAIIGVLLSSIARKSYEGPRTALYIGMGWAAMACARPLFHVLTPWGFAWLVAGGLAYTLGVVFFALDRKYFHAVWHVFVMAGSAFHYFAILFFVVLK
ncbi:MAG TPA: hemolysin III family protein [candidate division Zixibacteria bacterium]|nr:hemolysin III family protein [candidate division Zixibacteria bacterium]